MRINVKKWLATVLILGGAYFAYEVIRLRDAQFESGLRTAMEQELIQAKRRLGQKYAESQTSYQANLRLHRETCRKSQEMNSAFIKQLDHGATESRKQSDMLTQLVKLSTEKGVAVPLEILQASNK